MSVILVNVCHFNLPEETKVKMKVFLFFSYRLILLFILRGNLQPPVMKEKQNCFIFLKNQCTFFYSPSTSNKNATPTATRKRPHPRYKEGKLVSKYLLTL